MKFLICIFLFTFCVFTQAQAQDQFLSLDDLIAEYIPYDALFEALTSEEIAPHILQEAKQGNQYTQLKLAGVYFRKHTLKNSTSVSEDLKRSLHWFKKAARQGNAKAQTILGTIYCCSNSSNFRGNTRRSIRKRLSLSNRSPLSSNKSPLVEERWVEALRWFEKAADQGNPEAQRRVAFALSAERDCDPRKRRDCPNPWSQ